MVGVVTVAGYSCWSSEAGLAHGSVVYLIPVRDRGDALGHRVGHRRRDLRRAGLRLLLLSAALQLPHQRSAGGAQPRCLFIFVAVVVSQLATRLKRQLEMARRREIDLRDLYAFSRRLAVAFDVSDIHAAIEDHLATVMQRKVVLFAGAREAVGSGGRRAGIDGAAAGVEPRSPKWPPAAAMPPPARCVDGRQRRGLAGARGVAEKSRNSA